MIERARGVKGEQTKQAGGQHLTNLLRGMKHARRFGLPPSRIPVR
jgi:hypothetical protein